MNCTLCKINEMEIIPPDGIIYENDNVVICHNLEHNIPGYLLLFPKQHRENIHDLTNEEATAIITMQQQCSRILSQLAGVERVYICSLGEVTRHVHFHIFPRYKWMLEDKSVWSGDTVDAAKLFDVMRRTTLVGRENMETDIILKTAASIKHELMHA